MEEINRSGGTPARDEGLYQVAPISTNLVCAYVARTPAGAAALVLNADRTAHILVNNAGMSRDKHLEMMTCDERDARGRPPGHLQPDARSAAAGPR
jgi:hypothetical protein